MKKILEAINNWLKPRMAVFVLVTAALLLEAMSLLQYFDARRRLRDTLEDRVLSELIIKALYIRRTMLMAEVAVRNHVWDAERLLAEPDSMYNVCRRVVEQNEDIGSCGIAFRPYYYPELGQYFEPHALLEDSVVVMSQIGSPNHDYTRRSFYRDAMEGDTAHWCSPYDDLEGAGGRVTSYAMPVRDASGEPVAAMCIDLHTDWMGAMMNSRHLYPSSFCFLLDRHGQLIASPSADSVSAQSIERLVSMINDSTVARTMTKNGRATVITFDDDEDQSEGYIFYAKLRGNTRWQLALVCYDDEVYADLRQMHAISLILMLLGLGVLGFILHHTMMGIRRLERAKVEREKMDSELHVAQRIQKDMLPNASSQALQRADLDICSLLLPAKEVGGDLYDFFVRDEKLFFCIGDVSGKGVPSALLMAVTHTLFRTAAAHETNPQRIMTTINELSCEGNESNMFVTLFVGVLDLPTGRLRYCNAGHDSPALLAEKWTMLPAKPNLPVGIINDFKYVAQEMQLAAGDTLFLYTDGLTEAMNSQRKQFGLKRVQGVLDKLLKQPAFGARQLLDTMTQAVHQFAEGANQSDDLTMLAFRYTPRNETASLRDELLLTNDIKQVEQLNAFIASVTDRLQMDAGKAGQVKLAVEEAVVNVMHYAYPPEMEGEIKVCAEANNERLKLTISDSGVAFDPTETLTADTTLSVEERPIGGLGIFLVRQLMDSINYERIEGRNVLTLRKSLT
jgi:sigma-B regulation protein RsbU (phosphoserine phosphatase)